MKIFFFRLVVLLTVGAGIARGQIFVGQQDAVAIKQFTSGGAASTFASSTNPALTYPRGIAFDSAGNLYVSNFSGNSILEYSPGGVGTVFAQGASFLNGPGALGLDSAGNVYVVTGDNTISKFTPGGTGSLFANGFSSPQGLAIDAAGNVYTGNSDNTIAVISPSGAISTFAGLAYNNTVGVNQPKSLAFDSAGNLFVLNGDLTIYEFTSGGTIHTLFANAASGVPNAIGMAFDASGALYVIGNSIVKFMPDGSSSVFATGLLSPSAIGIQITAIPEPSTFAAIAGLAGLGLAFWRRRAIGR